MTKPVVVTLPFALLLLDYWPLERVRWELSASSLKGQTQQKISFWLLIAEKIPLFLLSALLSVITYLSQKSGDIVGSLDVFSVDMRIANVFVSYIKYIGKTIWPSKLAVIYPYPRLTLSDPAVIGCAMLFILITILSVYLGRSRKYLLVGWLWFIGTLVPMIGLVQVGAQPMANRYMYISILGLLIIIVFAFEELVTHKTIRKILAAVSATALLVTLGVLTYMQVQHWQSTLKLFEYTVKVTEDNSIAENNLGSTLYGLGRYDEAVTHLTRAIRIRPEFFIAINNLGKVLLKQKKLNGAKACFGETIKQNPEFIEAYLNLAGVYARQGNYDQAMVNCAKVERLKPGEVEGLNAIAWTLALLNLVSSRPTARRNRRKSSGIRPAGL